MATLEFCTCREERVVTIREIGRTSCDFNYWAKVLCHKCIKFTWLHDYWYCRMSEWKVGEKFKVISYKHATNGADFSISEKI